MKEKIKVLIVDDSAVFRQTLTRVLSEDPSIEIIGTASDPFIAATKMSKNVPDVITLDIEMPRMDGLTFLRKIMSQHPIPVVMISSLTGDNMESTFKAFEYGAVEVMSKEMFLNLEVDEEAKIRICDIIKNASEATLKRRNIVENAHRPKLSADAVISQVKPKNIVQTSDKVIVVGASTGGTEAVKVFLEALPADVPGIVIVQHMPEHFTKSFADRLNNSCKIEVKEAEDGDKVISGRALIAPGNMHVLLKKTGKEYYVQVKEGPLVNRHRPSVDVLFRSTALYAGNNGIGIILTGMGDDGAKGLLEMKEAGAYTIAQDEKSCVVFGMPKEAIKLNAAEKILCLEDISHHMLKVLLTLAK